MMIPKPLFPRARVALVAPASAVPEEKLQPALEYVRSLGLEPVVYPSCYFANRDGYLAAPDAQRAKDMNDAFAQYVKEFLENSENDEDQVLGIYNRRGFDKKITTIRTDFDFIRSNRQTIFLLLGNCKRLASSTCFDGHFGITFIVCIITCGGNG